MGALGRPEVPMAPPWQSTLFAEWRGCPSGKNPAGLLPCHRAQNGGKHPLGGKHTVGLFPLALSRALSGVAERAPTITKITFSTKRWGGPPLTPPPRGQDRKAMAMRACGEGGEIMPGTEYPEISHRVGGWGGRISQGYPGSLKISEGFRKYLKASGDI